MSSDIAYRLLVDMSTRGNLAGSLDKVGGKAKSVEGSLKKIKDAAADIGKSIASSFTSAVESAAGVAASMAKMGAVGAGAAIAYGVTHLNNELEKTQISLAAIFNAQGLAPNMTVGMRAAGDVMEKMRIHARDLPGELKDLQAFFKLGITPGLQLGGSVDRIEKLSSLGMAAAASTGVQMDQAAREFAQLLQGRAGAHNVFGSMLGFTGDEASKFNATEGDARLKLIETALKKYEGSIDTFGDSFDAQTSTLADNAKKFHGTMTAGLFERTKIVLKDANTWFDRNQDSVLRLGERIGESLNYAFEVGRRKIEEWGPPVLAFALHAKDAILDVWHSVEPVIERLGPKVKSALYDEGTFDHIRDLVKLYGLVKGGSMLSSGLGPFVSGLSELGGGGAGIASLGAVAGPAAIGIGSLAFAAEGAYHVLTTSGNELHKTATELWKGITVRASEAADAWTKLGARAQPLADLLGVGLLKATEYVVEHVEALGKAANLAADAWTTFYNAMDFSRFFMLRPTDPDVARPWEQIKRDDDWYQPAPKAMADFTTVAEMAKTKKGAGGGGGGTTIQKVEIVVSSNQDPSRIARMVEDRLMNYANFPTSSSATRKTAAARP